jgi:FKBP12-rapamycin complex-associated protein
MGHEISPYSDYLLPIIIGNMHDNSSLHKQEVSVRTLGHLVTATGLTVKPYLQFPQLLPKALDILSKPSISTQWSLRVELLRTLGILGALEPQKYSVILSHLLSINRKQPIKAVEENVEFPAESLCASSHSNTYAPYMHTHSQEDTSKIKHTHDHGAVIEYRKRRGNSSDDLIRSEVLLDDDNADAPAHLFMYSQCVMRSLSGPTLKEIPRSTPQNEDYYPRVAITALTRILQDRSLAAFHASVARTVMVIFKALGIRYVVPFLDDIVPFLLQVVRQCGPGLRESLLQQFSQLVAIIQHQITPYLPSLFELIHDYWKLHLEHILALVEQIAMTSSDAFSSYMDVVLPLLLSSLTIPKPASATSFKAATPSQVATLHILKPLEQTLSCCIILRRLLLPYLHLVAPALCKLLAQFEEYALESIPWQTLTVLTLRCICTGIF